jgi:hypothetical protein
MLAYFVDRISKFPFVFGPQILQNAAVGKRHVLQNVLAKNIRNFGNPMENKKSLGNIYNIWTHSVLQNQLPKNNRKFRNPKQFLGISWKH